VGYLKSKRQTTMTLTQEDKQQGLPKITFSDSAATQLEVASHHVKVNITLPLAKVTSTLQFINRNDKTLAGELVFPLPDNATVIGYALDVDGTLIDAVPIEKEKAKVIFEEEVRSRGKGVALVEMASQSNSFKTSIYPLKPNTTRTVKVVYNLPVSTIDDQSTIVLPFGTPSANADVDVTIEWHQRGDNSLEVQLVRNGQRTTLNKNPQTNNEYKTVQVQKSDLDLDVEAIVIKSDQKLEDNQVTVEGQYFCARIKVDQPQETAQVSPAKVQILYDVSYSRRNQHKRDLKLLGTILNKTSPKQIVFTAFSLEGQPSKTFDSIPAVLQHFEKIVYDGATNLANVETQLDESADYCIAITDGLHTLGIETSPETVYSIPLYVISTTKATDQHLLSHIATKSGGAYLNANVLTDDQVAEKIGTPVLYFLVADYEAEHFEQIYPNEPVTLEEGGFLHLYGKIKQGGEIAVMFKYGREIADTRVLQIEPSKAKEAEGELIVPYLWAKQKLNSLSAFPKLFDKEMRDLSMEWKIVSANTSLIVLETVEQYLKHDIIPPITLPDIHSKYTKQKQAQKQVKKSTRDEKIQNVLRQWNERKAWHEKDFQEEIKRKSEEKEHEKKKKMKESSSSIRSRRSEEQRMPAPRSMLRSEMDMDCLESLDMASDGKSDKADNNNNANTTASIQVQKWSSDEKYMTTIKSSSEPYETYLELRTGLQNSPAFFLDIADYYLVELKQNKQGVNILTNILELELESEQLLRIVGYRLDQAQAYELAEIVFEKVKQMRPDEPQSYRDLALVKEKLGKLKEAAKLLNQVIYKTWDRRFNEVELTAAIELSHVLQKDQTLEVCHEGFRYKMDLDLRISMAWDTNDTDVDLHVYEGCPCGKKAYYGHRNTIIGGFVSRDFTQGYGPEEYMLKKAPKGEYKICCNYYSNHQQSLTGGTTILLTFFTNYMRPEEKSETVTVRLTSTASLLPVCTITV
jgi:Ca-activated chloride channel family protein